MIREISATLVGKSWGKLRWLLAELMVVFLGVYLAFWLSVYQEQRKERTAKIAFCESVMAELVTISRGIATPLNEQATQALRQLHDGDSPLIQPPLLFFDSEGLLIRSAVEPSRFDAIGKDLAVKLALGHNGILSLRNRVDTFREFCGGRVFTRAVMVDGEGEITPSLAWYQDLLTDIAGRSAALSKAIEEAALPDLKQQIALLKGQPNS